MHPGWNHDTIRDGEKNESIEYGIEEGGYGLLVLYFDHRTADLGCPYVGTFDGWWDPQGAHKQKKPKVAKKKCDEFFVIVNSLDAEEE